MKIRRKIYTLQMLVDDWRNCTKCEIGKHCRQKVHVDTIPTLIESVDILIIGEGPGTVEDIKGYPFVGPAGKLLRQAITNAGIPHCKLCKGEGEILDREVCTECRGTGYEVTLGFTNLIACRPYAVSPTATGNRPPTNQEVLNCMPRLISTIKLLNPSIIVAAGSEVWDWIPTILEYLAKDDLVYETVRIAHPSYYVRNGGIGTQNYRLYVGAIRKVISSFKG